MTGPFLRPSPDFRFSSRSYPTSNPPFLYPIFWMTMYDEIYGYPGWLATPRPYTGPILHSIFFYSDGSGQNSTYVYHCLAAGSWARPGPCILFPTCHFKSQRFDLNDVRFVCKYIFVCFDRHTI